MTQSPSLAAQSHYGGGREITALTSNLVLRGGSPRLFSLTPTAARDVTLPDARLRKPGGPHFLLLNQSAAYALTIKDNAGAIVATVAPETVGEVFLIDNATQAGAWIVRAGSFDSDGGLIGAWQAAGGDYSTRTRDFIWMDQTLPASEILKNRGQSFDDLDINPLANPPSEITGPARQWAVGDDPITDVHPNPLQVLLNPDTGPNIWETTTELSIRFDSAPPDTNSHNLYVYASAPPIGNGGTCIRFYKNAGGATMVFTDRIWWSAGITALFGDGKFHHVVSRRTSIGAGNKLEMLLDGVVLFSWATSSFSGFTSDFFFGFERCSIAFLKNSEEFISNTQLKDNRDALAAMKPALTFATHV